MCPKCKSWDRYRPIDRAKWVYGSVLDDNNKIDYSQYAVRALDGGWHTVSAEVMESFICSNCGYEIGRWG